MKKNILIFILMILGFSNLALATHFRGGTFINAKIDANNIFTGIMVSTWRKGQDVATGPLPFAVYNVTDVNRTNALLFIDAPNPITNNNDPDFETRTATINLNLSSLPSGIYAIRYRSCCRIGGINNITDSINSPYAVETVITRNGTANSPPIVNSNPAVRIGIGQVFSQNINATDLDGDFPLSYQFLTNIADPDFGAALIPNLNLNTATGEFSMSATNTALLNSGDNLVAKIRITDSTGAYADRDVMFIVENSANNTPTIDAISGGNIQQVAPAATLSFSVTARDADTGQNVTLSALGVPTNASFTPAAPANPTTGDFTFTPTAAQLGQTFGINFDAKDNDATFPLSATRNVQILVNNPPAITSASNGTETVTVGQAFSLVITATDPDGQNVTITSVGTLPTNGTFTAGATGATTTATYGFTPSADQAGQTFTINCVATDSLGGTTNFTLTITVPNTPPVVTGMPAGTQTIAVGQPFSLTVTATDPTTAQTVLISASNLPANAVFTPAAAGNSTTATLTFTPSAEQAGQTFTINCVATDSFATAGTTSFDVVIQVPNTPPVVTGMPAGTQTVAVGQPFSLTVTATDPTTAQTVLISASNLPANAVFTPAAAGNSTTATLTFTPSASQAGQTFTINCVATDSFATAGTTAFDVVIEVPNTPPMVTGMPTGTQTVNVGQAYNLTVTASDPTVAQTVTISAANLPANATFTPNAAANPTTGTLVFTPSASQAGQTFTINCIVRDSFSPAGETTFDVIIEVPLVPTNIPPTVTVPTNIQAGVVGQATSVNITATDLDTGQAVTLTMTGLPAGATFTPAAAGNPTTAILVFTPTVNQAGQTFVLNGVATDNGTSPAITNFTIVVAIPSTGGTAIDTDNDGVIDTFETLLDNDNDNIPNFADYDPTGYFYDEATGAIIAGGGITVTCDVGTPQFVGNFDGSQGFYQFIVTGVGAPSTCTIAPTIPVGFIASTSCLNQGQLDVNPGPAPQNLGSSEVGNTGILATSSCAGNPFYLSLVINAGDAFVFNNNIPLTRVGSGSSIPVPSLSLEMLFLLSLMLLLMGFFIKTKQIILK